MRAALFAIFAVVISASLGCHNICRNGCGHSCGSHGTSGSHGSCGSCGRLHAHRAQAPTRVARLPHGYMKDQMDGSGAPPSATYAYPYYTLRAPRDFLLDNPPGIGP